MTVPPCSDDCEGFLSYSTQRAEHRAWRAASAQHTSAGVAPSLLRRVIPDGTSPAKQGSACLAASLPYLPSPSLSLKGSPVTGWPDEVMAGSPQRGAFVSRAQPILSGVRFYITCCGPLSLTKFTSFDSPTWEPSPSL